MMQSLSALQIEAIDPQHPQALALLAEAAEEARALYPELFAVDAPAPANAPLRAREIYLVAKRNGQAVGCGALRQQDAFTGEVRRMFVARRARRLDWPGMRRPLARAGEGGPCRPEPGSYRGISAGGALALSVGHIW